MRDGEDETSGLEMTSHGSASSNRPPALQVICLGSGGGPCEDNVTGFLVRSVASEWARGSLLAVDAGSHLAPIVRILERDFPGVSSTVAKSRTGSGFSQANGTLPGLNRPSAPLSLSRTPSTDDAETPKPEPTVLSKGVFAGLKFPNASARANALHVIRNYVNTYLITHPHLDHFSGFAINTAAFHATSRPKTLAALPSTVDAIKQHIFNDVIWPNLSDEDGGVGFVTFQRLKEGGDVMVGEGEGRGYIEISDGLGVKAFKVSHGVCTNSPPKHHHRGSVAGMGEYQPPYNGSGHGEAAIGMTRSMSISGQGQFSAPGTPGVAPRTGYYSSQQSPRMAAQDQHSCVVDSTVFFIRDTETNREVLICGDVEPDSISLSPRNYIVWQEAARKIVHGSLAGIFIECSYDDSQADAILFGHLNPKHLIAELQTLAKYVIDARIARHADMGMRKRKRSGQYGSDALARHENVDDWDRKRSRSLAGRNAAQDMRRASVPHAILDYHARFTSPLTSDTLDQIQHDHAIKQLGNGRAGDIATPEPTSPVTIISHAAAVHSLQGSSAEHHRHQQPPLHGVKVVIIHVKDTMKDGPHVSENILEQLRDYEQRLQETDEGGLGCEFVISESGESYWF